MKSYTYKEFRDICRTNIDAAGSESRRLREAKASFPKPSANERKAHSRDFHASLKRVNDEGADCDDPERLEILREQGRSLRLKANIENGARRAALVREREVPRLDARCWSWLYAMARLKTRQEIEGLKRGRHNANIPWEANAVRRLTSRLGSEGFEIQYKYGSVKFTMSQLAKWIFEPHSLPTFAASYLKEAKQKSQEVHEARLRAKYTLDDEEPAKLHQHVTS